MTPSSRPKTVCKYLSILIDSNLNFCFHLKEIENKLSKSLGMLYKLKPILPQNALLKLYHSMVHSHLLSELGKSALVREYAIAD